MAARTKWRRKLKVGGRQFLWYVADDEDGLSRVLHLFSQDKSVVLWYWLERQRGYPGSPILVLTERGVRRAVSEVPNWGRRSVVTPGFVREIAEWALEEISHS
jgi:hypothetical protein